MFGYRRKADSIAAEAALDGLYVIPTCLSETELDAATAVRTVTTIDHGNVQLHDP